ncbi:hypothetical protein ACTHAL_003382 [Priestia flexa]|uniref:hypothetical protein n=1 Tax=Priestia flexa TaxID=86664 RepID=UPI003F8586F5
MNNKYREKLITEISEVLPPLSDSIFSILNSIKLEQKIGTEVIEGVSKALVHIRKALETLAESSKIINGQVNDDLSQEEALELMEIFNFHLMLKTSLEDLADGITIILYLHSQEQGDHYAALDPFLEKINKKQNKPLDINTSIDSLFNGSQILAKVINDIFK